jgi:non-canonical purine NTP pyrophosphatase (RdgB/HAM1 family)
MSFETAPFVLVTGNRGKIAEARLALGMEIEAIEVDLPEIQSLDLLEVLQQKAEMAWEIVQSPLVVEEAGLGLLSLNGFPGPLVKWMLEAVGAGHALGDPRAVARCALLYRDSERTVVAEGSTSGTLVLPGRGGYGFGWDPVFLPDGKSRTFAELEGKEKDAVSHRGKAWRELMPRLGYAMS